MKPTPPALPARMNLNLQGFHNLDVAVLELPYAAEIAAFCRSMKLVLNREVRFPHRQLNAALLACAPTLTHGFEQYRYDSDPYIPYYRALAVGTPAAPLQLPAPETLHWVLRTCVHAWLQEYRGMVNGEADSVCDRLLRTLASWPDGWAWKRVQPEAFLEDLQAAQGIGYAAIPALLATLLHGRTCTVQGGHGEQHINWRKVVGATSSRTGLHLVSQPFHATYTDQNGAIKAGYFAYRLDFSVQTQAGRVTEHHRLRPWVFLQLSCQRYAHEPLKKANFRRDVSALVRVQIPRMSGVDVDGTLVRLPFEARGEEPTWSNELEHYLSALKARPLESPAALQRSPQAYANLHNSSSWSDDEYYLVHAEGLLYGPGREHKHTIKTGYAFDERAAIVAQVLDQLAGILIPDGPLTPDRPAPKGIKQPLAMRDYTYLEQHPDEHFHLISEALSRVQAADDAPLHIMILWRERETLDALLGQVHRTLGLDEGRSPDELATIAAIYIDDADLVAPLDAGGLRGKDYTQEMVRQHDLKRRAWQAFLQRTVPLSPGPKFALIEIGTLKAAAPPKKSIRGAVREACAREGISSQLIQTVIPKRKDGEDGSSALTYSSGDKGRLQNAVLDSVFRQQGVLLGAPAEIYHHAGLPAELASTMDVITFSRRQTTGDAGHVHYALAVRLSAEGQVHILLPENEEWLPYREAGPLLGLRFSHARSERWGGPKRQTSSVRLDSRALASFVAATMTIKLRRPTLFVIEADVWRNGRSQSGPLWPQLQNERLSQQQDVLDFAHLPAYQCYQRDSREVAMILGVVRLRSGSETPQYVANRYHWLDSTPSGDFKDLSGFVDETVVEPLHYFSVGRLPVTQQKQARPQVRGLYKLDRAVSPSGPHYDFYGANYAFKHQRLLELVPFFVRPDLQGLDGRLALCRAVHYLRTSPAWVQGNLSLPYPMHLGGALLNDQLCILGYDD